MNATPLLLALLAAQDTSAPAGWRAERLDLELFLLPAEGLLLCEGTLEVLREEGPPSDALELAVRGAFADAFVLTGPESLGARRSLDERRVALEVRLAAPVAAGGGVAVGFAFEGRLEANQFAVTPEGAVASWVERWTPMPLEPPQGRAPVVRGDTVLHLPAGWSGVTNGVRIAVVEDGSEVVETWRTELPVARSFAAGPFRSLEAEGTPPIGIHLLESDPTRMPEQAETLRAALAAMEERFGPYPYSSYHVVEAPMDVGTWGASSEQGFLLVKPNFFATPGGNLPLLAHEAAHGWWGNLVGQRGPGSILCSEALAQYGAVLAIEALEGPEAATEFLRFSREGYVAVQCARGYFELAARGHDAPLSTLEGGGWQHNLADAKGHWVWHMLRRRVGDELFFGTLRGLLARFAGRRMALDDLRAAFVAAAPPEADVERFLAQWLDRAGAPRLELSSTHDRTRGTTTVLVRQVQEGEPYALRLDLALVAEDGSRRLATIPVEGRETRVEVPGPRPAEVLADPEHRLLLWTPDYAP